MGQYSLRLIIGPSSPGTALPGSTDSCTAGGPWRPTRTAAAPDSPGFCSLSSRVIRAIRNHRFGAALQHILAGGGPGPAPQSSSDLLVCGMNTESSVTENIVGNHLQAFLEQRGVNAIVADDHDDARFYSESRIYQGKSRRSVGSSRISSPLCLKERLTASRSGVGGSTARSATSPGVWAAISRWVPMCSSSTTARSFRRRLPCGAGCVARTVLHRGGDTSLARRRGSSRPTASRDAGSTRRRCVARSGRVRTRRPGLSRSRRCCVRYCGSADICRDGSLAFETLSTDQPHQIRVVGVDVGEVGLMTLTINRVEASSRRVCLRRPPVVVGQSQLRGRRVVEDHRRVLVQLQHGRRQLAESGPSTAVATASAFRSPSARRTRCRAPRIVPRPWVRTWRGTSPGSAKNRALSRGSAP